MPAWRSRELSVLRAVSRLFEADADFIIDGEPEAR
jgi:hypothetical protein